ncbi:hypothetical protein K438DRAFT_2019292 [Mycena galopus ATCC 62051]|nr:hypothetical protein K438DRAFT_2019292 [Mycena galopus ATCC 62051]
MEDPDWNQVQVDKYPDSPWLHKPPSEKALQDYLPDLVFRSSEVRDSAAFVTDIQKRTLFGHPSRVTPIKPGPQEYIFAPSELSPAPAPTILELKPPGPLPTDPPPPNKFMYPQAPTFTLRKTDVYQRGYAYTAPYYLSSKDADHARMMRVVLPPQLSPRLSNGKYEHDPVPNCVQMVPGVPFAFEIDGDPDELHTIGAIHTFESLRHEPEFWDIYKDTVLVAKGLRGCRPAGNTDTVFPISDYPLKPNDRSPTDLPSGSKEGSFNLANTLLKGIGKGVVLPAAQVDTPEFRGQLCTVLQALSRLRRLILQKTVTKLEYDATEFNSEDMNIVGYGGLEPNNGTSCQTNFSGNWKSIAKTLGISGAPHTDSGDEDTRKTHVMVFFDLPPDSDPGAFLLARAGLYLRELNTWAVHIIFDGVDVHAGIGTETSLSKDEFRKWVETELETAWNHSFLSRIVVVQYAMRTAHNRDTHMSMTPSVRFGNIGPELPTGLRDFATHGQEILGGQEPWANRMGREIIFGFWNQLQLCNLDLDVDIDHLMQSITFKNSAGEQVHLKPLPFHPVKDAEMIARKRGHFEYLRQRYLKMRLYIEKWRFIQFRKALVSEPHDPTGAPDRSFVQWPSRSSISTAPQENATALFNADFEGQVVKILDRIRVGNECCFRVLTDNAEDGPQLIHQNDARLPTQMVQRFLASEIQKVTSVPILDLHRTDSTNQDVGPVEPGPSSVENTKQIEELATERNMNSTHPMTERDVPAPNPQENVNSDHSMPERDNTPPAPNPQDDDPEHDPEYEIEKIVDVAHNAAGTWYSCKFVGYAEEEWTHANELNNCDALLKEFYASLAGADSHEETESESETDRPKRKKKKPNPRKQAIPNPSKKRKQKSTYFSGLSLDNTEHLAALMSSDRLALEVKHVQDNRPTQGRASTAFFSALASPMLIPNILELCYSQSQKLTTLEHVIDNNQSSQLEIATAEFTKLTSSAAVLTQTPTFERVTGLLTRVLRWTSARAHIVVYRWCASTGPNTIKDLFELHRTKGFNGFKENRALGLVVDHVVQHVCDAMKRNPTKHITPSPHHGPFGPIVLGDLTHIPGGLYGLLDKGGKQHNIAPIKLPDPARVNLYAACQTCLLEVFRKAIIMPALRACETMHASSNNRSRTDSDDGIICRAICRGAVLDCIVDVCQDDGILASSVIDTVIDSPWLAFPISRSDRLGAALQNRTDLTLAPLKEWLSEQCDNDPQIREHSKGLGDEIHSVLLEMTAGQPHPDTIERLGNSAATKPPTRSKMSGGRTRRVAGYIRPDLEVIVPTGTTPRFTLVGLVIREALNLSRGLEPGDVHLRRLLQGHHATQSMAGHGPMAERNPDHLNPRREFNHYTMLFKEHLSPIQLTSPVGLSNALSWFGTGQGFVTEQFLNSLRPSGGFFKDDANGMVQQFQNVISQNQMLSIPMQFDNSRAWGRQPNPALLAQPTKKNTGKQRSATFTPKRKRGGGGGEAPKDKLTLHEKFDPLYAEAVQTGWTKHLGTIAGKDPMKAQKDELPTWASTVKLMSDLEIPAFKTGLTAMQLVNTLAFSHVVRMPTVMEMADWIAENKDLGAVTGLEFLGFRTSTRDQIRASYICFHHFLEHFLIQEDRDLLGFHPPFTEHVLCKIPRWNQMLKSDKSATLEEIAAQLGSLPWKSGQNLTDATSLPLPVVVNRVDLENALKQEDEAEAEEPSESLQANTELQAESGQSSSLGMGRLIEARMSDI